MSYTWVETALEDPISTRVVSEARDARSYAEFLAAILNTVLHLRENYQETPYLCHILTALTRRPATSPRVRMHAELLRRRIWTDLLVHPGRKFSYLPDALWRKYPNLDPASPYAIRIAYLQDLIKEENRRPAQEYRPLHLY